MKWYRGLYMGEGARKAKYKVLGHVVKKKFSFDTYLITLPSNTSNILDIYSANVLLQPHFKKKCIQDEIYNLAKITVSAHRIIADAINMCRIPDNRYRQLAINTSVNIVT